jgi:phosphoglycolate phosphatase
MKQNEFGDFDDDDPRNYRVLVFDLDCLIEDPRSLRIYSLAEALIQLADEENLKLDIPDGPSLELLSSSIEANLDVIAPGLDKQGLIRLLELVQQRKVEAILKGRTRLQPEIQEAIEELKEMGYLLAIQSPDDRDYLLAIIDYFELDRYIDISICSGDVGRQAAELQLLEILEKEELLRSEAILISNRGAELDAARQMGIVAIGCLWGGGSVEEMQSADHMVESPADLVMLLSGGGDAL